MKIISKNKYILAMFLFFAVFLFTLVFSFQFNTTKVFAGTSCAAQCAAGLPEDYDACMAACAAQPVCGNHTCETGESYQTCPSDCACVPTTSCAVLGCGLTNSCGTYCGACLPLPDLVITAINAVSASPDVVIFADVTNIGNAPTGTGFYTFFQRSTAANGGGTVITLPHPNWVNPLAPGGVGNVGSTSFPLPALGTSWFRACTNGTVDANGNFVQGSIVTESNFNNNCSAWKELVVTGPATVTNLTISSPTVIPNGTTQYTITISGNSPTMVGDIQREDVCINCYNNADISQWRGSWAWIVDNSNHPDWQGYYDVACSGGGRATMYYGYGYIHIDSCSVSDIGNTRTVSFVVRFDPSFTFPTVNKLYGSIMSDHFFPSGSVQNFDVNFSLNPQLNLPDLISGVENPLVPIQATVGNAINFSASISNNGVATGSSFSYLFQVAGALNGDGTITDLAPATMQALAHAEGHWVTSPSYTFNSVGSYSFRVCADKSSSGDTGTIAESNENNNCSAWGSVIVNPRPINGGWTPWSPTSCPTACGLPASNQTRTCTNPTPAYGGADCSGSSTSSCAATPACICSAPLTQNVTVACDVNSYGYPATSGVVTRSQTKSAYPSCTFPTPVTTLNSTYVSDTCVYPAVVNGGWSAWSTRDNTCGYSGTQTRTCTNPAPSGGGADCVGSNTQTYTNAQCPINGGWTPWSPTSCPTACGLPASNQTRTCTNPTPAYGGADCSGSSTSSCAATPACICSAPLTQNVTVACDVNSYGYPATSGVVTRSQTKSAYPSCTFPTPVTTLNSTYVSDTCVYPAVVNGGCSTSHYNCNTGTSVNNVDNSTTWTWSCNGSGGGTNAPCSENKPTGTLTGSDCIIPLGANTCTTTLNLNINNPIAGALTNITKAGGVEVATGITPTAKPGIVVNYPNTTFYLNHNGVTLATALINATCITNSHLENGVCTADTRTVTATAGANGTVSPSSRIVNYGSTTTFTVNPDTNYRASVGGTCPLGSPLFGITSFTYTTGAITTNCTVTITFTLVLMSGTLTPSSTSCTIVSGAGSCTTPTLIWTTTNPIGTSTIISPNGGTPSPWSGNNGSRTFTAPYDANGVIFQLWNNGVQFAQAIVTTSCASGTTWSGSTCLSPRTVTSSVGSNSGSISPSGPRTVSVGSTQTYTVSPGTGNTTSIGGTCPLGSPSSGTGTFTYTTGPIVANCTVVSTVSSFTLTTLTSGTGSGTINGNAGTYANGAVATITATPNAGSFFQGWSGGSCSGTGICNVTMNANRSVTAIFTIIPTGTLTISNTSCNIPAGSSTCSLNFTWLTTNPLSTSVISTCPTVGCGGIIFNTNSGSDQPYNNIPQGSSSYYLRNATYLLDQKTVTGNCAVNTTWNGNVCATDTRIVTAISGTGGTISPTSRTVNYGSTTTFTVTPDASYSIDQIYGCNGLLSDNIFTTGSITNNCTVNVSFAILPPDLTAGSVTPTTATTGTALNFSATISDAITASTGSSFFNFFQVASVPASVATNLLSGDSRITDLAPTIMPPLLAGGSNITTSPSYTFNSTGTYSARACADKSSSLDSGTITESNESNNCGVWTDVVVTSSGSGQGICAAPIADTQTLNCPTGQSGSITQTRTKTSYPNCTWGEWITTSNTCTTNSYSLIVNMAGTGTGSVTGAGTYNYGDTATATATANAGSTFTGWSGDCTGTGTCSLSMTANKSVTATFRINPTGTLTGPDCVIPLGASTCTTTLNLNINNPINGALTNITKTGGIEVATGITPTAKPGIVVNHPSTTFYLNHNGATLATTSIGATCVANTTWDGGKCVVNTLPPPPPPTVGNVTISSPTIAPNNTTQYTITVSATSQRGPGFIPLEYVLINYQGENAGQYRGYLKWSTSTNNWSTLQDYRSCDGGGHAIVESGYGNIYIHLDSCSVSDVNNTREVSFVVRFNPLFTTPTTNNDISGYTKDNLEQASGWQNTDLNFALALMSGVLYPDPGVTSCIIPSGSSSCPINFSWNVTNPEAIDESAVTRPINITVNSGRDSTSSPVPFTIPYNPNPGTTFFLYNNAKELARSTVTADCFLGTSWNGDICTSVPVVDGVWGDWGSCSNSCGPGLQFRSCIPPSGGGRDCVGPSPSRSCTGLCASSPDLTADNPTPRVAVVNVATTFSSKIYNIGNISTGSEDFYNFFQVASVPASVVVNLPSGDSRIKDINDPPIQPTSISNLNGGGANETITQSYSFPTVGTYSIRACADKSSAGDPGKITESCTNCENNNCSAWVNVEVNSSMVGGGSCALTHYNCSSGIPSTNNVSGTSAWTWSCPNPVSGRIDLCSEPKKGPAYKEN